MLSPAGHKLLYLSDASGCDNLWISNVDGSDARQITHETVDLLMGPAWSADGQTVAASKMYATYPKLNASEIRSFEISGAPQGGGRVLVETPENKRDVQEADFSPADGTHESPSGQRKVGQLLLRFFKTDPTTRGWFLK